MQLRCDPDSSERWADVSLLTTRSGPLANEGNYGTLFNPPVIFEPMPEIVQFIRNMARVLVVGAGGLGCEPASAASVAGAKQLVAEGVIGRDERVVCILTGHQLKDPTATVAYHTTDQKLFNEVLGSRGVSRASFANRAVSVGNRLDEIVQAIDLYS